jgi:hypothetical protein
MKKTMFFDGLAVVALVLGLLAFTGCDPNSSDPNRGRGGIFTLTDIPTTYNGKYVVFTAELISGGEPFTFTGLAGCSFGAPPNQPAYFAVSTIGYGFSGGFLRNWNFAALSHSVYQKLILFHFL